MDDLISRQAAIDALDTGLWGAEWDKALATAMLKDLPPVQPKPKTGHWIDADIESAICSCCNRLNRLYGTYCKHCGSKND